MRMSCARWKCAVIILAHQRCHPPLTSRRMALMHCSTASSCTYSVRCLACSPCVCRDGRRRGVRVPVTPAKLLSCGCWAGLATGPTYLQPVAAHTTTSTCKKHKPYLCAPSRDIAASQGSTAAGPSGPPPPLGPPPQGTAAPGCCRRPAATSSARAPFAPSWPTRAPAGRVLRPGRPPAAQVPAAVGVGVEKEVVSQPCGCPTRSLRLQMVGCRPQIRAGKRSSTYSPGEHRCAPRDQGLPPSHASPSCCSMPSCSQRTRHGSRSRPSA